MALALLGAAWFFLLAAPQALAAKAIVLGQDGKYSLAGHLEILEDPGHELTIGQVASNAYAHRFQPAKRAIPNLGINSSVYWFRFTIKNPDNKTREWLLVSDYPSLDELTLYAPVGLQGFQVSRAGDSVPASGHLVSHCDLVYVLSVPAGKTMVCYLRLKNTGAKTLPLTLWRPTAFFAHDHTRQLLYGLFFGLVFGFMIYFSATAIKLRHAPSMWFVFYLASLMCLDGARYGFFLDAIGWVGPHFHNILHLIGIGMIYFTGAKFFRVFLDLRSHSLWVDRVEWGLQWMGAFYIPMCLLNNPVTPVYAFLLVCLGPLFSSAVAAVLWFKGAPNARYFAMGWLVGHITSTVDLLRIYGTIPYDPVMSYTLPVAVLSALAFFSIALVEQLQQYKRQAGQDPLTKLANLRAFRKFAGKEWNRQMRNSRWVAVMMCDVDHFKDYNDTYGHKAGDHCLKLVSRVLTDNTRRASEIAARVGGEEFALFLSDIKPEQAMALANKIRAEVEALGLKNEKSPVAPVLTVSVGVALTQPKPVNDPDWLLHQADQAMYRAKQEGRNRVCLKG